MKEILVSIIIPLFNREKLVLETLDSITAQTYPNWECIIIDDGSTDNSFKNVKEYCSNDSRFKVLKRETEPKGAPVCRQIGVTEAKGELFIFFDSDDLFAPWSLQTRVDHFLSNPNLDLLLSNGLLINTIDKKMMGYSTSFGCEEILNHLLMFHVVIQTPSVTWSRKFYEKNCLIWDSKLICWQDVDLAIAAFSYEPIHQWGNELPDYFNRKDNDPNAITSMTNIIEKIVSNFHTYEKWLQNEKNNKILKHYFPNYMVNKLEYLLTYDELNQILSDHYALINKHLGKKVIKYLFLYNITRNIRVVRSIVFRLRPLLCGIKRQSGLYNLTNNNEHLKKQIINKLIENNSPILKHLLTNK